jgi:ornithine decarboxylase
MKTMKIAVSRELLSTVSTHREKVTLDSTDFTDVAAVVMTTLKVAAASLLLKRTGFQLPVFIFSQEPRTYLTAPPRLSRVKLRSFWNWRALPAVTKRICCRLFRHPEPVCGDGQQHFACPGHQHGAFFKKHPAGRQFYDFFGENVFRADMCNADVKLGDLLIHEGSASTRKSSRRKCSMRIKPTSC